MKVMTILVTAAALAAPAADAHEIERRVNSPAATISSVVSVPPDHTIVFLSGSVASPIDATKPNALGDTKTQTLSILSKLNATLSSMGMTMGDVVKMTVFLVADPKLGRMDSPAMNEVFKTFFGTTAQPHRPARSTVQVAALGRPEILVEIEAIAAKAP